LDSATFNREFMRKLFFDLDLRETPRVTFLRPEWGSYISAQRQARPRAPPWEGNVKTEKAL
jgi:hypothetical protein